MQDNTTTGETGIPILKDVPVLGGLFSTDSIESRKTELLILITPYILDDPKETELLAGELQRRIDTALYSGTYESGTILPASLTIGAKPPKPAPVEVVIPKPVAVPAPGVEPGGPSTHRTMKYPRRISYECDNAKAIAATFQTPDTVTLSIDDQALTFIRDQNDPTVDRFLATGGYVFNYTSTMSSIVREGTIIVQRCVPQP